MPTPKDKVVSYVDFLRLITPIGVTISLFILGSISSGLKALDHKVFKHLTNDEIHVPRGLIVGKGEFELYRLFEEEEEKTVIKSIDELKMDIRELIKQK